jgi:hypothetical protein
MVILVLDRKKDPTPSPFRRGSASQASTSPAGVTRERPAADPLHAAGRPASLIREVEVLLVKHPRFRLSTPPSAKLSRDAS